MIKIKIYTRDKTRLQFLYLFCSMYRKAGLLTKKKESKAYVVAKKGMGKKVTRPSGVKGHFKVVDPRMKKDNMRAKKEGRQKGKKGKQRGRKGKK